MPKKEEEKASDPRQATLHSFFGMGGAPKKQTSLKSFLKPKQDKENNNSSSKKRDSPTTAKTEKESDKRRRHVIMDDSDDESMEESKPVSTTTGSTPPLPAASKSEEKPAKVQVEEKTSSKSVTPSPSSINKTEKPASNKAESKPEITSTAPARLVKLAKDLAKAAKVDVEVEEIASPVHYEDLAIAFEKIDATTKRLEIQSILTSLLRRILQHSPKDLHTVIYLASNSVAPAYDCVELGIGDALLIDAIAESFGSTKAAVKAKYEKEGCLGKVAFLSKGAQKTLGFGLKPKPLKASEVLSVFRKISSITGNKSKRIKTELIKGLLVKVQNPSETKYIIKGLQGKLRIGLAESTVLISLAHALVFSIPSTVQDIQQPEESELGMNERTYLDDSVPVEKRLEAAVNIVKQCYFEVPSYDALLDTALKVPFALLHKECPFSPGIPVNPMLAKPTKSIQEVLTRLNGQEFTCEFKYDGERAQVHRTPDGQLKVFSRNLKETTAKYPEITKYVNMAATDDVTSYVMDAEVVAYNKDTNKLAPFQILSTRKKEEISDETAKVQVIVQGFDLMYLNGKSLLEAPLKERRTLLKKHFLPVESKFQYATSLDFVENGDTAELETFLDASIKGQCEGLMVKTMDDIYEPSRRSLNWLKLKKDYLDGPGDSFDLVPLGAYYGRGKRTGVYGAYLLACYDEDSEEFQSVCKIGTGFSDEDLKTLSASLNEHKINSKSPQYNVSDQLECDVWFDSVQVWEIKAADLSKSSTHRGAVDKTGEEGRGIGLRFPRFERVRGDKKPEDATSSNQIIDLYYNQDTVKGMDEGGDDGDI